MNDKNLYKKWNAVTDGCAVFLYTWSPLISLDFFPPFSSIIRYLKVYYDNNEIKDQPYQILNET